MKEKIYKCRKCGEEFEPLKRNGIIISKFCITCLSIKGKEKQKKDWNKKKKEFKEKDRTLSEWKNILQPLVNKIARLIDYGQPCIATGYTSGKMNGGHFISVGANDTIRFNLHNIHMQSEYSNSYKGGDNFNYADGLEKIYGLAYLEHVRGLNKTKQISLSSVCIKETIIIAKKIIKEHEEKIYSPSERIALREKYNEMIGIYEKIY